MMIMIMMMMMMMMMMVKLLFDSDRHLDGEGVDECRLRVIDWQSKGGCRCLVLGNILHRDVRF